MGIETLLYNAKQIRAKCNNNLAKLLVLHKLSFKYSSLSNLINTFDDLFPHTYVTNLSYEKEYHLNVFRTLFLMYVSLIIKEKTSIGDCLLPKY